MKKGTKRTKETKEAPSLAMTIIWEQVTVLKESLRTLEKVRKEAENVVSVCKAQEKQIKEIIGHIKTK